MLPPFYTEWTYVIGMPKEPFAGSKASSEGFSNRNKNPTNRSGFGAMFLPRPEQCHPEFARRGLPRLFQKSPKVHSCLARRHSTHNEY